MSIQKSIPKDTIFIVLGAVAQFGISFAFSGGAIAPLMISNACFDLIYAGKCAMNREIDFQDFMIKKSLNLALGVASSISNFVCGAKICADTAKNSVFWSGFHNLTHLIKA